MYHIIDVIRTTTLQNSEYLDYMFHVLCIIRDRQCLVSLQVQVFQNPNLTDDKCSSMADKVSMWMEHKTKDWDSHIMGARKYHLNHWLSFDNPLVRKVTVSETDFGSITFQRR